MAGCTLWFTGLSGAGKTTVSNIVEEELRRRGRKVEVLDGDVIRTHLSKGLGFSKEDRDTNIKRIAFVCELLTRNGVIAMAAAISPYCETRDYARSRIGDFIEIFVNCPVDVCADRDVKGLYKKAMSGEIKNFTGVSDPYEEPKAAEVILNTHEESPQESAAKVIECMEDLGYLEPEVPADAPAGAEEGAVSRAVN